MPATPARISFVSQEWRSAVAQDTAVRSRWGEAARDTSAFRNLPGGQVPSGGERPVETFFDSVADAQAMAEERLDLLKADRRRVEIVCGEVLDFSATSALAFNMLTPTVRAIDPNLMLDANMAVVDVEAIDYDTGRTVLVVWG